jgi:hypothetical protein
METKTYHTVSPSEKQSWGDGPWLAEPDKVQYPDAKTGYPVIITRHESFGNLCGYVGVQEGHPLFGKSYDEVWGMGIYLPGHGDVNFADRCQIGVNEATGICHVPAPGESDVVWWYGFDCAHGGDLCPKMEARYRTMPAMQAITARYGPGRGVYRDLEYVKACCADLAQALKEIADGHRTGN